jgi:exonuclease VII large subunit
MHMANSPAIPRRSSRVQTAVPILVTSLDDTHFSEVCETLVVNAHGCAMLTRVKLAAGAPLHFHSKDGREATAQVVSCQSVDHGDQSWRLGAKLDRPDNFWGLQNCPKDWALPAPSRAVIPPLSPAPTPGRSFRQVSPSTSSPLGVVAPHIEVHMKKMIAESIRPLRDEIAALSQQLERREANPSRFEVSLSNIPPELEHQLEVRLRRYLGPRLLDETRQQSAHLLEAATGAIEQKTTQGYENFLHRSQEELKLIEKRAEDISARISASAREHLSCGLDTFQRKLLDGGNALKRLSEELLAYLQHNLKEEHDARRQELEQLRTSVAAESLRLQEQIQYLDGRIAKLNESAQRLESGLEQRLDQLAGRMVTDTRGQFEASANQVFDEITERIAKELGDRLKVARENLETTQTGIVTYVRESLKGQSAEALQSFECSMGELATQCIDRWRFKLAGGLNALAKSIGEQFQLETGSAAESRRVFCGEAENETV